VNDVLVNSSACPDPRVAPWVRVLAQAPEGCCRNANSPGWSGDQPGLSGL